MADTQTILFGADTTECITAVEVGETEAILYIRHGENIEAVREPFDPWLLVTRAEDVPEGLPSREFEGEGFRFMVTFPNWSDFHAARGKLRSKGADTIAYANPEKQFLMSTGKTLFKGMSFDEVHRMQIDIETTSLSYEDEGSRLLLIAVSDNCGCEEILEGEEADMLSQLTALVRQRDPDVIEGHNFFGFDLPYLAARAKANNISLALGRDGSETTFLSERSAPIGGYSKPFTPARIYGRHVIDTLLAVQRFDTTAGKLERYGLKDCALVLGLSEPDRVHVPGDQIASLWETEPERIKLYARHDVRETRALAALVCPAEFYLTQMTPDTYQSVATTGQGEKINSIIMREYLRQGHAISRQQTGREVPGGYTELRASGMIRNVVKCDVESLYPSLMLSRKIKPANDTLDIFLPALSELTRRRIEAKGKAKTGSKQECQYWDGLQSSFKILINSFYGYLGAPFNFNDFDAAKNVTTSGQAIVKQIAESIEQRGGKVIEIDTDGVYFQAPHGIVTEEDERKLIDEIGSDLPEGINLAHDGRYAAMLSLKIKNYVLVGYNGKKTFKGASVRSRADERFGKEFISKVVDLLAEDNTTGASALYNEMIETIREGKMHVDEYARRERVTSKTFKSTQKKRSAAVAKGVAVGEYITIYNKNNGELGLLCDYDGDEDRDYLMDKLYKFASRLREGFGEDFDALFPKPGLRANTAKAAEAAGQKTFDLFG